MVGQPDQRHVVLRRLGNRDTGRSQRVWDGVVLDQFGGPQTRILAVLGGQDDLRAAVLAICLQRVDERFHDPVDIGERAGQRGAHHFLAADDVDAAGPGAIREQFLRDADALEVGVDDRRHRLRGVAQRVLAIQLVQQRGLLQIIPGLGLQVVFCGRAELVDAVPDWRARRSGRRVDQLTADDRGVGVDLRRIEIGYRVAGRTLHNIVGTGMLVEKRRGQAGCLGDVEDRVGLVILPGLHRIPLRVDRQLGRIDRALAVSARPGCGAAAAQQRLVLVNVFS